MAGDVMTAQAVAEEKNLGTWDDSLDTAGMATFEGGADWLDSIVATWWTSDATTRYEMIVEFLSSWMEAVRDADPRVRMMREYEAFTSDGSMCPWATRSTEERI